MVLEICFDFNTAENTIKNRTEKICVIIEHFKIEIDLYVSEIDYVPFLKSGLLNCLKLLVES